jgi:hypothetical protein
MHLSDAYLFIRQDTKTSKLSSNKPGRQAAKASTEICRKFNTTGKCDYPNCKFNMYAWHLDVKQSILISSMDH